MAYTVDRVYTVDMGLRWLRGLRETRRTRGLGRMRGPLIGEVFFIVTHIYGQTMYILQNNCPHVSFPGCREASSILHGGKMHVPHFKDAIASLQKWPF